MFPLLAMAVISFGAMAEEGSRGQSVQDFPGASVQLIRNATLKLRYGNHTYLVDPMLGDKGELSSMLGVNPNPRVRLPVSTDTILEGVDDVICTHTHFDHYDERAAELLADVRTFCQPADTSFFRSKGIPAAPVDSTLWDGGVRLTRLAGQHGKGELGEWLGPVSGFVIQSDRLPSIYIVGDCILTDTIVSDIRRFSPDFVVLNTGGAIAPPLDKNKDAILMTERDVVELVEKSPEHCTFIAVHMEALDHCQTTRSVLRDELRHAGIDTSRVIVPEDGEVVSISWSKI